jgi:hypothetical protein
MEMPPGISSELFGAEDGGWITSRRLRLYGKWATNLNQLV